MSSTSDRKSKFFFANCLHCDGIIRIPIAIRPSSEVACPHCANRVQLHDLMDQIPEGEVVAGQGDAVEADFELEPESTTQQQDGKFIVPAQLAAGIKKRRRRRRRSSESSGDESSRSSSSSSQSAPNASSASVPSPSIHTPNPSSSIQTPAPRGNSSSSTNNSLSEAEENRRARKEELNQRRREEFRQKQEMAAARSNGAASPNRSRKSSRPPEAKRSPVMEVLKIGIGGMLAAPIAYLLLLWVFSRDPLGLAPTIYSVAPPLVPEWIIDNEEDRAGDGTPNAKNKNFIGGDDSVDDFFKNIPKTDGGASDTLPGDTGIDFNETVFD